MFRERWQNSGYLSLYVVAFLGHTGSRQTPKLRPSTLGYPSFPSPYLDGNNEVVEVRSTPPHMSSSSYMRSRSSKVLLLSQAEIWCRGANLQSELCRCFWDSIRRVHRTAQNRKWA